MFVDFFDFLSLCIYTVITKTPPTIVEPPLDTTGRAGQAINLTCIATGIPTPSIKWFQDDKIVDGATFQFLYFPSVKPTDRGYFYCVAENSEGSVDSNKILLSLAGIYMYVEQGCLVACLNHRNIRTL